MKTFLRVLLVLVVALLMITGGCATRHWLKKSEQRARHARVDISGRVYDEATGTPIAGAFVIVHLNSYKAGPLGFGTSGCLEGSGVVRTDAQGQYHYFWDFEKEGFEIPDDLSPSLRVYSPGREYGTELGGWFWFLVGERTDFPLRNSTRSPEARQNWLLKVLDGSCVWQRKERGFASLFAAVLGEVGGSYCRAAPGTPEDDFSVRELFLRGIVWRLEAIRRRVAGNEPQPGDARDEVKRFRQLWHDGSALYDDLKVPDFSRLPADKKARLCTDINHRANQGIP